MSKLSENFDSCVEIAAEAFASKGFGLSAESQVANIFGYAASDPVFKSVCETDDKRVLAELRSQIKYICELGLDAAKGRKLVYVRTRNVNVGTKDNKVLLIMPDISESYHALIHVLVRSKALKNIIVQHTYQNYPIEHTGNVSDVPVVKSWAVPPNERGTYTGLFVTLCLPDGEVVTSFHHAHDLFNTHRSFSKSSHTWKAHEQAMCAKSAILDAVRYIPVFDETIAQVVEHYDDSMEYSETPEIERISEEQVANIEALLEEVEGDKGRLLKWIGASSLDRIQVSAYDSVIQQLEKKRK